MTMPIDLVLVRHGESEGNVANARSRRGDHSVFTQIFLLRHSSSWRLTDRGIAQIRVCSDWISKNIMLPFDRHYTSEYARAMETAATLNLPQATWYLEPYLRERDYGELDVMADDERKKNYSQYLEQRERSPLFSIPPNGESMATLCLRIDRVLNTLHRECSDKRVIVVCHGEVMLAFRIRLERLAESQFRALVDSEYPDDRMHNGQILHYTRKNPETGQLAQHLNWMRSVCPSDLSLSYNKWQKIRRPKFTNQDLMNIVSQVTRTVNSE